MLFFANGNVALYMKDTNAAIIFSNIYYWCLENKNKNKNFFKKDGDTVSRYWTYDTIKTLAEKFYFLSESQIRTSLEKLEDKGLIITGNFNKLAYDRTKWYSVTEKGEELLKDDSKEIQLYAKSNKSICEISQMEMRNIENGSEQNLNPIPHNNTHNESHNDTNNSTHSEHTPFDEPSPFDDSDSAQSKIVSSSLSAKPSRAKTTKTSAKGSYPNEYYKTVLGVYKTNYRSLLDSGRLKTPMPTVEILSVKGLLKKYFDAYGYETILDAVKKSVNDEWLIEHGYVFHHIFGERKLVMLINDIKFENNSSVTNSLVRQSLANRENFSEDW